ncbi:nucleosome assembly protein 1-like 5 [Elephas maximus indicus]|uniref:nucleosome assembly protein 1-like 5 n=1 Tax=Elephas maximus indicus TaxID=99487 RepID=UPI0021167B97|nr:nucleosome assembly protein 1-like 5 [Elephas maximus indicus]
MNGWEGGLRSARNRRVGEATGEASTSGPRGRSAASFCAGLASQARRPAAPRRLRSLRPRLLPAEADSPRPHPRVLPGPARAPGLGESTLDPCGLPSDTADPANAGSAAPSAAAAEEVMAAAGAQGGDDGSAEGPMAAAPQPPAENAAKPRNDFLESLHSSVKCRVLALKKLQKRCDKIEAKFDKEFQALEKKYNDIYKPLLAKIHELTGEMEGCAWTLEAEEEEEDEDEQVEEEKEEESDDEDPHSDVSDDADK